MEIILTIIITIFVYNVLGCLLCLLTNDNEYAVGYWAIGIVGIFIKCIDTIRHLIQQAYIKKYFKALLVDKDGNLYYCESKMADDYRCGDIEEYAELDLNFARDIVNKYSIKDGWLKRHCQKYVDGWLLSARYVPLKVCLAENAKKI